MIVDFYHKIGGGTTRDHAESPFLESNLKDLFHVPMQGKFILMLLLFQYCWHFHFWSVLEIGLLLIFTSQKSTFSLVFVIFFF